MSIEAPSAAYLRPDFNRRPLRPELSAQAYGQFRDVLRVNRVNKPPASPA